MVLHQVGYGNAKPRPLKLSLVDNQMDFAQAAPNGLVADRERVSGASTVAWAVDDSAHPRTGSPVLQVAAVWMPGEMAPEAGRGVHCLLRAPYRCGTMV